MNVLPAIEARSLTHFYGERQALVDVSFRVHPGQLFGLLGPNGGGKTTLFRILSTLLRPTQGTALIDGIDVVTSPAETRRRLGIVFQAPSVDAKLTVLENLRHQGHLYGFTGSDLENRIRRILERMGLADRARDRVETLSGGLRRRVELGKGLLHDPGVLLLDEPTTGLDAGARREFRHYLQELSAQERFTVLLTTHLMDEAEICDQLVILDRGRLVAEGSPSSLKEGIAGEVLVLTAEDPERLCRAVRDRFGGNPRIVENSVRMEQHERPTSVTLLLESFHDQIQSLSVHKPTLEDVFIHHTGHGFWDGSQQSENAARMDSLENVE